MVTVQVIALLLSVAGFLTGSVALAFSLWSRRVTDDAIEATAEQTDQLLDRLAEIESALQPPPG